MSVHDSERMSGGPQVFLGATTFCVTCRQISGCREEHLLVPVCLVCPWAAARPLAVRAASFARRVVSKPGQAPPPPTDIAAGPAGFAASSDRVALILFRLGSAAAHGHRSRVLQASQQPPIGRSDEHSPAPPQPTNSGIREVPTQFVWCRAQWRRQLNPAQKRIRTGPLLLALTRRRVSSLLGRRTCRSTPRRRWGGSNQAGWPGADST